MPIYEYRCEACGHEMEAMQKMADDPLVVCPNCGESSLKKLMSAPGFRLKGGGWYETDFKTNKRKNVVEDGGKKSDTATGSGSASDSGKTTSASDKKGAA